MTQVPLNQIPIDMGTDFVPVQPETGIRQEGLLFSPKGREAMAAAFVRENIFAQTIDWIRGAGLSGEIDSALSDYHSIAGWSEEFEQTNPFDNPRVLSAPKHYWTTLARAETADEVDIILGVLRDREEEVAANMDYGGSALIGAMAGATLTPSGLLALRATRFGQLPAVAGAMTLEELAINQMDPTRSLEESTTNVVAGTATVGAFIAVQKAIYGLSALVPQRTAQRYAESVQENVAAYRDNMSGPWGPRSQEEGFPFMRGEPESDAPTTRLNPEDDLDDFDPLDQSGLDVVAGRFRPPVMGRAGGEKMVKAAFLEVVPDNPVKRTLQGESDYARGLVSHLTEHPFFQMKNLGGMETAVGVDRIISQKWIGQSFVPAMRKTEDFYAVYRQRLTGSAQASMFRQNVADTITRRRPDDVLSPNQFLEAAYLAKINLDNPGALAQFPDEVVQTARLWDDLVYKPLGEAAKKERMFSIRERRELARVRRDLKEAKTTPPGGTGRAPQETAEKIERLQVRIEELKDTIKNLDELDIRPTFANRLYRHDSLNTPEGRAQWIRVLAEYGRDAREAERIRQKILGEIPYQDINRDVVGLARSLKERELADIPDTALAPFLENNLLALGRYYALRMGTDVELMRKFGSVDLFPHIRNIEKEFDIKIARATSQDAKDKLIKQKHQTVEDIETIRDRVRGTYGMPDNPDSWSERGIRIAKMWNATSMLTGAFAAVPDMGHIIMREGLSRSFKTSFEAFSNNMKGLKLAHQEANLAGEAIDMYVSMRAALFADLGDSLSVRNKFERALGAGTQGFFNVNLMNPWNVGAKTLTSLIAGSRLIEDAILTSKALRKSGTATLRYGSPRASDDPSRIIMASYNRRLNRVTVNKKELQEAYARGAWRTPRIEGVRPIDDAAIQSLDDFERFIIQHELAHADFARKTTETLADYENRINQIALRRMTLPDRVDPEAVTRLRRAGISKRDAAKIADQAESYGHWGEHVRIARSHLWDDARAAQVFRSALGKEINITIVTPGKGDLPNFVGGGFGKIIPEKVQAGIKETVENLPEGAAKERVKKAGAIFMSPTMSQLIMQFKSFGISAQHRVLTPAIQQFNGNTLMGVAALVGLGFLVDKVRREQSGYPAGNWEAQLMRAIERSGIMGYITDAMRAVENLQNPISNPGKVLETLGGPIVHQIDDVSKVLWDYGRLNVGSRTNAALVDIMPLSNVAHLKWLADAQHHSLNVLTGVK